MNAVLLTALLLSLSPEADPPPAEPTPSTAPSVRLEFAWPPGLEARVTARRTRTTDGNQATTGTLAFQYTLRVDAAGENLRVRYTDAALVPGQSPGPSGPSSPVTMEGFERAKDLMSDFVVTKAGAFVGIHDLPAVQTKLRALVSEALPKDSPQGELDSLLKVVASESFLTAKEAEGWNAVVGAWVGGDLEIGATYASDSREPLPILPGEQVMMRTTFEAKGETTCRRGGMDRRCVELEMRTTIDQEDLQRVIGAFMSKFSGADRASMETIEKMDMENVILLVTEPEGLIPHSFTHTKFVRVKASAEGKPATTERLDTREMNFSYP